MMKVVYAMLPAFVAYIWLFGWGVLLNLLLATAACLAGEALVLALRGRPVMPSLLDGSALVTGLILGIALPQLAPWWLPVVGGLFAIIFAKQLYGGLGFNPFNPAMVGYVVLLIAYPLEMTSWVAPDMLREAQLGLGETLAWVFAGIEPAAGIDSVTMATPLDTLKTQIGLGQTVDETIATSPVFGHMGGTGWEVTCVLFLLGGLWMIYQRVITWHVPVAAIGSLFLIATVFHLIDPQSYASPMFHIASGGAVFGAFFIATDPVSGATSDRGRLVFGAGIGLLEYIIRVWGGYPDSVAFSVLLMNMAAPTIDYYTRPRVFGQKEA
jgi:electron transport complex protein RnfD